MSNVFTVVPGAVMNIAGFGVASNDVPAVVPSEVAAEFAGQPDDFRVEETPTEPTEPPAEPEPEPEPVDEEE